MTKWLGGNGLRNRETQRWIAAVRGLVTGSSAALAPARSSGLPREATEDILAPNSLCTRALRAALLAGRSSHAHIEDT